MPSTKILAPVTTRLEAFISPNLAVFNVFKVTSFLDVAEIKSWDLTVVLIFPPAVKFTLPAESIFVLVFWTILPFVDSTWTPSNLYVSGAFTPVDNNLLSVSPKTFSALSLCVIETFPKSTLPFTDLILILPDFKVTSFKEIFPLFATSLSE